MIALWYWSHYSVFVEMFDNEDAAADEATNMEDQEYGSCAGVQYPDGRFVERSNWSAYYASIKRRRDAYAAESALWTNVEPRPSKNISPPFDARGKTTVVDEDTPDWVGKQNDQI